MRFDTLTGAQKDFITELIEKLPEVRLTKEGIVITGFYKSGEVKLVPVARGEDMLVEGLFKAHSRYDTVDNVHDFDDLVAINYMWWERSKNRADFWKKPDDVWLPYLIESGRVTVRKEEVTHYE